LLCFAAEQNPKFKIATSRDFSRCAVLHSGEGFYFDPKYQIKTFFGWPYWDAAPSPGSFSKLNRHFGSRGKLRMMGHSRSRFVSIFAAKQSKKRED